MKIQMEDVFRGKYWEIRWLFQCFVFFFSCRYFPFLAKQKPGHPECDILTNVFAILSAKNLSEATASIVVDIADDLLTLPDFEPTESILSLPVTGCVYTESADGMCAAQSKWFFDFWGYVCYLKKEKIDRIWLF